MNTVHDHAQELHDHLAAVTHSLNTATVTSKQHYSAQRPWFINSVYQDYHLEDIYHTYHHYTTQASDALLNMNMDSIKDIATTSPSIWYYVIGCIVGIIVLYIVYKLYVYGRSIGRGIGRVLFMFELLDIQNVKQAYIHAIPHCNLLIKEVFPKSKLVLHESDLNNNFETAIKRLIAMLNLFFNKYYKIILGNDFLSTLLTSLYGIDADKGLRILLYLVMCNFTYNPAISDNTEYVTALFILNYIILFLPTIRKSYSEDNTISNIFKDHNLLFILQFIATYNRNITDYKDNELHWFSTSTGIDSNFFTEKMEMFGIDGRNTIIKLVHEEGFYTFYQNYQEMLQFVLAMVLYLSSYGYGTEEAKKDVQNAKELFEELQHGKSVTSMLIPIVIFTVMIMVGTAIGLVIYMQ